MGRSGGGSSSSSSSSSSSAAAASLLALLSAAAAVSAGPSVSVRIGSAALGQTNERYASYNVDGSWNRGFFNVDWTNPNLRAAAASLA